MIGHLLTNHRLSRLAVIEQLSVAAAASSSSSASLKMEPADAEELETTGKGSLIQNYSYNSYLWPVLRSRSRPEPDFFAGAGAGLLL